METKFSAKLLLSLITLSPCGLLPLHHLLSTIIYFYYKGKIFICQDPGLKIYLNLLKLLPLTRKLFRHLSPWPPPLTTSISRAAFDSTFIGVLSANTWPRRLPFPGRPAPTAKPEPGEATGSLSGSSKVIDLICAPPYY